MKIRATELRRNIYRILDQVLETGVAVEILRKGKLVRIVPVETIAPLERLQPMAGLIAGDPASLEHVDWSGEWRP